MATSVGGAASGGNCGGGGGGSSTTATNNHHLQPPSQQHRIQFNSQSKQQQTVSLSIGITTTTKPSGEDYHHRAVTTNTTTVNAVLCSANSSTVIPKCPINSSSTGSTNASISGKHSPRLNLRPIIGTHLPSRPNLLQLKRSPTNQTGGGGGSGGVSGSTMATSTVATTTTTATTSSSSDRINSNDYSSAGSRSASLAPSVTASCSTGTSSALLTFYDNIDLMANDSKYKSYVTAVDKALKSFEYTSEWADLVSALSKLNRVLTNNNRFRVIPRRFIVGQRLAQCMHPRLPSGVHLKALETYNLIFNCIGQERLLAELTIYSNGLFPLLSFAAINVRPAILDLYERHLLPLGDRLKPALDGFLIGVLPCLDEGTELMQRIDKLLLQVSTGVGAAYFYSALWRCILQNSSIRLPAITFITLHFNKKRPLSEQAHILGICMQTLVRAICASLLDAHILVQRAILDLLLTCFPLHLNLMNEMQQAMASPHADEETKKSPTATTTTTTKASPSSSSATTASSNSHSGSSPSTLSRRHFKRSELVAIITAALTVLLRRDATLNRRLCDWFFGTDSMSSTSGSVSASASASATSVPTLVNPLLSKSSATAFMSSTSNPPPAGSGSGASTGEIKIRRKKLIYFENHARDLVIEAFKRCIINPVTAITSILPATAITNSFISFTLPFPSTLSQQTAASVSSSPSNSTTSLQLHSSYRQGSDSGTTARSYMSTATITSGNSESYTSNSTFWPYRLLICILDQREIATPILETLCVDILRGLFHEFELLTNVIPPPCALSSESGSKATAATATVATPPPPASNHKTQSDTSSTSIVENANHHSTASSLSSSNLDLTDFCDKPIKDKKSGKVRPNQSKIRSRRKTRKRSSRKLSASSSGSKRNAISASAPTVAVVSAEKEEEEEGNKSDDEDSAEAASVTVAEDGVGKGAKSKLTDGKLKYSTDDESVGSIGSAEVGGPLDGKKNLNLPFISNLNQKFKLKMKWQRPLKNSDNDGNTQQNKIKTTMKTMPFVKQFRQLRLSKNDNVKKQTKKSKKKKSDKKAKQEESELLPSLDSVEIHSVNPKNPISYEENSGRDSCLVGEFGGDKFDEDLIFALPHQHYYWNPHYQQLDRRQRRELLKELDRVMHLLFTNVGVDFIWNKLALIFQSAAKETMELKKLVILLLKKSKRVNRSSCEQLYFTDDEATSNALIDCDADFDDDCEALDLDSDSQLCSTDSECSDEEETDTVSHSSSFTWLRSLASSVLATNAQLHSSGSNCSTQSSTPYASPRVASPNTGFHSPNTAVNRQMMLLADRCRQCGETLPYTSPVQPVGTDSLTILEACTLTRFLLGDSLPYHLARQQDMDDLSFGETPTTTSLLTNSISVSMNRCSALEPLAVDSTNYHFLIQFLDHILKLMCDCAKAFTTVDLRASVELCLALCAKLKPTIMQTFVLRYKHSASDSKCATLESRKMPTGYAGNNIGGSGRKTRSSSTASSKKPLEFVKEEEDEDGDDDVVERGEPIKEVECEESRLPEVGDDLKIELVVQGVLEFFVFFVEKILVKVECGEGKGRKSAASRPNEVARVLLQYYRDTLFSTTNTASDYSMLQLHTMLFEQQNQHRPPPFTIRHHLLPIYEQLCELLVDLGTMPVLTSPAFILQKRSLSSSFNRSTTFETFTTTIGAESANVRWFLYLLILSSNRLATCVHTHQYSGGRRSTDGSRRFFKFEQFRHQQLPLISNGCCQKRQIAYTSLSTILDLLTICRAYLGPPRFNATGTLIHRLLDDDGEFRIPPLSELKSIDLFPGTFTARRLNFFPLIQPELLVHVHERTCWFKLVAICLWSNLSINDSQLHHASTALLQQLHSISIDSAICDSVICDEMISGPHCQRSRTMAGDFHHQHHLLSSIYRPNNLLDQIYDARAKFTLMFSIIRDVRFISERLALIVTALASAGKNSTDIESDTHSIDYDPNCSTSTANTVIQHSSPSVLAKQTGPVDLDSPFVDTLDMANFADLDRILRFTCPVSPIALCTTLKRHFDRPLFIMLDALAHRRTMSENYAAAADWLYTCLSPSDLLGTRNMFLSSSLFTTADNQTGGSGSPLSTSTSSITSEHQRTVSASSFDSLFGFGANTDIGRLLEPLLFILLHPKTSRLSVQNVNIHRYTRRKCIHNLGCQLDQLMEQVLPVETDCQPSKATAGEDQIDESKIYAISSTNGNVIYHVRRRPPVKQSTAGSRMKTNLTMVSSSGGQKVISEVVSISKLANSDSMEQFATPVGSKMNVVLNPFELASREEEVPADPQSVIESVVEQLVDEMICSVVEMVESEKQQPFTPPPPPQPEAAPHRSSTPHFPGMARTNLELASGGEGHFDSSTKINISYLHMHLLLYERQYDSVRTIYALDTILNMIETWPIKVLYAMATTTLLNSVQPGGNPLFDGTRAAQIQTLYSRHRNSILGRGFHYAEGKAGGGKKTVDSGNNSILRNISLLELIVQICLQYLRSYYSSCPANKSSTEQSGAGAGGGGSKLDSLFSSMSSSQSCVDIESIHGNQRVRLLVCEILRVIFHHLSTMIDSNGGGRGGQPAGGTTKQRQSQSEHFSIGFQLKPFAQYLYDMLLRCEVQRNVLQCLVTSVWHYQQKVERKKCAEDEEEEAKMEKPKSSLYSSSYLYPSKTIAQVDPAANAFIKEILDYNDYPARGIQCSKEDDVYGFHDEFEKCLLRLLEQVMIIEWRVTNTVSQGSSSAAVTSSDQSYPQYKMQRFNMDLTELRFDATVSLAGQPLLHGAIQLALQQNFRRHIHSSWLSFVESSLIYSGRFLSRLVTCVLTQLCRNLDNCTKQIDSICNPTAVRPESSPTPPFTSRHILVTLQGITMLCSYCLLDKSQIDPLVPFLNEMFEENEDDIQRTFGLAMNRKNRKRFGRSDLDSVSGDSMANVAANAQGNGATTGPMQLISSLFHNIMITPTISSSSQIPVSSASGSDNSGNSESHHSNQMMPQADSPALLEARKSILSMLNRVLVSLFTTWCSLVVAEDSDDDSEASNTVATTRSLNTCCHHNSQFRRCNSSLGATFDDGPSRSRFNHSNCSLGWSSSAYTGWYIMGSSAQVRRCILTTLSVIGVTNGTMLMSSLAQVWRDSRDQTASGAKLNFLNGSIDLVIAPVSKQQRQLVRLMASLNTLFTLETLIQTIRSTLKQSQSVLPAGKTKSNPLDIFLIEVSLLEFFLAYIRTCTESALLNSWRSVLALIKDGLALNVAETISSDLLMPAAAANSSQSVSINFQPLVNFHLLAILHEFVIAPPYVEDRRAMKELQEVAQKLIDAIVSVAGGRLSHSRWTLRRNFEVLPMNSSSIHSPVNDFSRFSPIYMDRATDANSEDSDHVTVKRNIFRSSVTFPERRHQTPPATTEQQGDNFDQTSISDNASINSESLFSSLFSFGYPSSSASVASGSSSDPSASCQHIFYSYFCIKALYALSEFAAPILDVVYTSEEKEKMTPLIISLMSYVVPYLRSHSSHNWPCFDACSRLLASLSGYQYTRKAWRKETLELLLDGNFFQMPADCLPAWRTIIDHLMTHDKNTFREFLSRMSVTQSPSTALKILVTSATVRDQEAESRAQIVKRLAFIMFCSEKDQYQRHMAEIQEKLIEIHRTSQSPQVQAEVLLAFRVIILRMAPHHLASLWPFIYTEMFQVFLSIEQQLLDYIRSNDQKFNIESVLSVQPDSLGNSYGESGHHRKAGRLEPRIAPTQLQLFLNACKLLDLVMLLPADSLPQFQLHRWAFLADSVTANMFSFDIGSILFNQTTGENHFDEQQQPNSINSMDNNGLEATGGGGGGAASLDTLSLDSLQSTSQPKSLTTQSGPHFVPHIVFINNILNFLSDSPPPVGNINCSMMAPLLTMARIESVHELHFFFHLLLHQSNRNLTMTNTNNVPTSGRNMPPPAVKLTPSPRYTRRNRQEYQPKKQDKKTVDKSKQKSKPPRTDRSNICSLEELFINIDRVIARDFLESLPNSD